MLNYPNAAPQPTKLSNAIYAALYRRTPPCYLARTPEGVLFTVYLAA